MIVHVLGSAAGGGVPQWNCACSNCAAARRGAAPKRTQSSIAISGDGERWTLVNCSPDIAAQIESFAPLQPKHTRGTPITGMLFTDANVDHLGGLAVLRQQGPHAFHIRSSSEVRSIAAGQPAFAAFTQPPHHWRDLHLGQEDIADGLAVRAFDVPGTTPGYDGRRTVAGAVVAYELRDPNEDRRVLVAPVFAALNDDLCEAIERATVAFLDGSFFTDGEMAKERLSDKTARHLGHLPVNGTGGTLSQIQRMSRERIVFTHINNSNPMLDPQSEAAARVREAGAEVAYDGLEIVV